MTLTPWEATAIRCQHEKSGGDRTKHSNQDSASGCRHPTGNGEGGGLLEEGSDKVVAAAADDDAAAAADDDDEVGGLVLLPLRSVCT